MAVLKKEKLKGAAIKRFKIIQTFANEQNIVSMVTSVYKWLSFSLIGCFFSVIAFAPGEISMPPLQSVAKGLPTAQRGAGAPHPFHVSTTEINHNATDKTLEISCRIFTDDFESCL